MSATTGRNSDQIALRFPPGQRKIIKALAAVNRRTMNAEVLVLIERGMRSVEPQDVASAVVGSSPAITVDQLFAAAFDMPRDPRSPEYKAGVRAALSFRIDGLPIRHPYPAGSAADDAFAAGIQEGHAIWRRAQAEATKGTP